MAGMANNAGASGWNIWRIARWSIAAALLLTPAVMMQVSDGWHWNIGSFLAAGVILGGMGLLYELAERASGSRAYRAGVAVALAGYVGFLFPAVGQSMAYSLAVAIGAIWILTLVNVRGVEEAGSVQIVTTVLKLVPLGMIGLLGLFWIDPANFTPVNISGQSDLAAISAAAP